MSSRQFKLPGDPVPEIEVDPTAFTRYVRQAMDRRNWSIAETARRAYLAQPELSRVMNERRGPTLRIVHGLVNAFFSHPSKSEKDLEPQTLPDWWHRLGELAMSGRRIIRERKLGNP